MRRAVYAAAVVCLVVCGFAGADPVIEFSTESVIVKGVTPGQGVYQLVVTREEAGYRHLFSTKPSHRADDARTGTVEMLSGRRIPQNSIWIAVDPKTGASAIATPRPEGLALESARLNPGQLRKVTRDGHYVAYLWVRPGVGAWYLEAEDSGMYDDDPTPDRRLAIDVGRMAPVGDSPSSPHQLAPGDALFAVDVLDLTVLELR